MTTVSKRLEGDILPRLKAVGTFLSNSTGEPSV